MPSEGRRQRQQRVRHEAGDYVTSTINEPNKETKINEKPSSENSKKSSNDPHSKSESTQQRNNQVNSSTKIDNKGPERIKGCYGNQVSKETEKKQGSRPSQANVAFAEKREYEGVSIMESKPTHVTSLSNQVPSEPTRYRRREVISNWHRYDDLPPESEPEEGEDYLMGEDFSQLLNSSESKKGAGFLHLKGERSWGLSSDDDVTSNHGNSGFGALKISELATAMATIPLHEQLRIPESALPVFTVSCFKSTAESNRLTYQPNKEYVSDVHINEKILSGLKLRENESYNPLSGDPNSNIISSDNNFKSLSINELDVECGCSSIDTVNEALDSNRGLVNGSKSDQETANLYREINSLDVSSSSPSEMASISLNINQVQAMSTVAKDKSKSIPVCTTENKNKRLGAHENISLTNTNNSAPQVLVSNNTNTETTSQAKTEMTFNFGLSSVNKNQNNKKENEEKYCKDEENNIKTLESEENEHSPLESKEENELKQVDETETGSHQSAIEGDKTELPTTTSKTQLNTNKSIPPILAKNEVENLEDWLDSVLDD